MRVGNAIGSGRRTSAVKQCAVRQRKRAVKVLSELYALIQSSRFGSLVYICEKKFTMKDPESPVGAYNANTAFAPCLYMFMYAKKILRMYLAVLA